jgi:tRNA A-37 threonylcarbamoyl transferase component Bud32
MATIDAAAANALLVEGPIKRGRYALIYRAHAPGWATFAIKCCIDAVSGATDEVAAVQQYAALQRVHCAMSGDPCLRTPAPLFGLPSAGIIAMEWIEGVSLTEHLLSWRTGKHEAFELMTGAGRWLRRFHDGHRLPPRSLDVAEKRNGLADLERSPRLDADVVREALAMLHRCASRAASVELDQTWQHGDFKSDNLLVCSDGLVGIDAHLAHTNAGLYDAASFVNHLELTVYQPRGIRWWPVRRKLTRAFLAAFDARTVGPTHVAFLWISLYTMLCNWNGYRGRSSRALSHHYIHASFRLAVRRLARELAAAWERTS